MANHRRVSKGLDIPEVKEMSEAWHFAATVGRPLNVLVSVRPENIDDINPEELCLVFRAVRNKLAGYARRHRFEPTFVWSREINRDGTGEHLHVLMHIPRRFRQHFEETLLGWFPGPAEMDVTTAHQRMHITANKRRMSANHVYHQADDYSSMV